jgi:hypothetical protein
MINFPSLITAGDDVKFSSSLADYTSATHTLSFAIAGSVAIASTTVTEGTGWLTTITAASTNVAPGDFAWAATLVDGTGKRLTVQNGRTKILPKLAGQTSYDPRSENEKTLAAIKAAISRCATGGGITQISFGDRSQTVDLTTLIELENRYQNLVNNEVKQRRMAEGLGDPFKVWVRFR